MNRVIRKWSTALRLLFALVCIGPAVDQAQALGGWVNYDFTSPPFVPNRQGGEVTPFTLGPTLNEGAPSGFIATFTTGSPYQWQVTSNVNSRGFYNPFTNGLASLVTLDPFAQNTDQLRIQTNMKFDAISFEWVALGNWVPGNPSLPTAVIEPDVPTTQVVGELAGPVSFSSFPGNTFAASWADNDTTSLFIVLNRAFPGGPNWGSFAITNLWFHVVPVPEPSTSALMALSLGVLVLVRRFAARRPR